MQATPEVKRPKSKRVGVPLNVYVPPAIRDAFHQLASEQERTVTAEVLRALKAYLEKAGKWPPPP